MAFSINRVTLLGRVANDLNLRYTPGERAVLNLRIATSYSYQKDGEWEEVPQFTNCVFWGRNAEILDKQMSKGEYLYVEGRLQTRSWEDKEGNTRYSTEVQVRNFVIPRNKGQASKSSGNTSKPNDFGDGGENVDEDSIPF